MKGEGRAAVYLDRDGTLVVERHYLADPEGIELVPGTVDALAALHEAGYALVVVTNQSGIARGLYTEADYQAVTRRFEAVLAEAGVILDGSYHCPHHPDFTGPCTCRKPAPGMYVQAAADLGLDPARSWYVGDKATDVLPALELGGRGILVRTGYGREHEGSVAEGVTVVDDIAGAARHILEADGGGSDGGNADGGAPALTPSGTSA